MHFDAHYDAFEQDWMTLIDAWEHNREPKPTAQPWECNYCIYREDCPHAVCNHKS